MAFQTVVCDIVYRASRQFCDGSGNPNGKYEILGDFETQRDAEQELVNQGFTRKSWGWIGNYEHGSVTRLLIEKDDD